MKYRRYFITLYDLYRRFLFVLGFCSDYPIEFKHTNACAKESFTPFGEYDYYVCFRTKVDIDKYGDGREPKIAWKNKGIKPRQGFGSSFRRGFGIGNWFSYQVQRRQDGGNVCLL